jgi:hypothetical protein
MTDVGFSSSAAGAAQVAATPVARPPAHTDSSASSAAAARNIADSVALSVEALQASAVKAPEKAGNQNVQTADKSSAETVQQLASRVEVSLNKMSADVGSLMRMFGLSSEEASAVQQQFVTRVAEKVGAPPEASIGMRAFVPFYSGDPQVLEAKDINVQVTASGQDFASSVDFGTIGLVTPEQALANTFAVAPPPMFTTPTGSPVTVTEGSSGVVLDSNGAGTRELGAVISGQANGVHGDGQRSPIEEQRRREALGIATQDPAEKRFGEAEDAVDANRDGVADQTDSGMQSLIAVKTGSAAPTVEGGTIRVAFDAIIPLDQKHDPANMFVSDQATKPSTNRVTEPSANGFDVKA